MATTNNTTENTMSANSTVTGINEITSRIVAEFPAAVAGQGVLYCRSEDRKGGRSESAAFGRALRDWARGQFPERKIVGQVPVIARDSSGYFKCWTCAIKVVLTDDERDAMMLGPHAFRALA
tara:strand:+ start:801 stop:1166 length:366 start_codon:yes stop_codon:yes gene_type:complete